MKLFVRTLSVESWPTTEGVVKRSEQKSRFSGRLDYAARVEYQFAVDGKVYSSTQIRTRGTSTRHEFDSADVVKRYPVGRKVSVYFNPDAPQEAYLEAGADFINYVLIISPAVFALLFGIGFIDCIRLSRSISSSRTSRGG